MDEESYFFKLSKWESNFIEYYEDNPEFISPSSRKKEVISFVKNGLKDLSISRKKVSHGEYPFLITKNTLFMFG